MYYKFHYQLPVGYMIPTSNRNIPDYTWLHHLLMSSFYLWLPLKELKDCYWILRTYDQDSFDVAFRLPKGRAIEDLFKRRILDTVEFSNNMDYIPGLNTDYDSIKCIKITECDFFNIIGHTDGRLMSVNEYVERHGYRYPDYVKPQENL